MPTLYDFHESGNGYKVRLVLAQLGIDHRRVEVDITRGESRTPEFLALNPNGRIPLWVLDDGRCLAESNAILWYLAERSALLPDDPLERARVLQWMFFEQYSHEPYIATVRYWHYLGLQEERAEQIAERRKPGYDALGVMECQLAERAFFVAERYGIADIALYAYTHVAHEGGYDLGAYPAVRAWLERVRAEPRHIPMDRL